MKLLFTCGTINYRGLRLYSDIFGNYRMYVKAVQKLRREGRVDTLHVDGCVNVRLSSPLDNYEDYLRVYGDTYRKAYPRLGELNRSNIGAHESDKVKATRALRDGEVHVLMKAAEVNVLAEEKKEIMMHDASQSTYYTSQEIKRQFGQTIVFQEENGTTVNSRTYGLLESPGGNYLTYHTGRRPLKYSEKSEGQMREITRRVLAQNDKRDVSLNAIVVGYNRKVFEEITNPEKYKHGCITVETHYPEVYMIPYTADGVNMLRLMCRPRWKEEMLNRYFKSGYEVTTKFKNCHAKSGDVHALLFCIPDIKKLNAFISAAKWSTSDKNRVFCFDYQVDFVKAIVGDCAEIYQTPFSKYLEEKGLNEHDAKGKRH